MPPLAPPTGPPLLCGIAAIDCNGRLADATAIPSLDWTAGTRLDIRVDGGLVRVSADPHAVFQVTQAGQVRLPAPVRHWLALTPGSRVLLVADLEASRLVVYPPATLHAMITQFHGGGQA
jgi:hypothetical protein